MGLLERLQLALELAGLLPGAINLCMCPVLDRPHMGRLGIPGGFGLGVEFVETVAEGGQFQLRVLGTVEGFGTLSGEVGDLRGLLVHEALTVVQALVGRGQGGRSPRLRITRVLCGLLGGGHAKVRLVAGRFQGITVALQLGNCEFPGACEGLFP